MVEQSLHLFLSVLMCVAQSIHVAAKRSFMLSGTHSGFIKGYNVNVCGFFANSLN